MFLDLPAIPTTGLERKLTAGSGAKGVRHELHQFTRMNQFEPVRAIPLSSRARAKSQSVWSAAYSAAFARGGRQSGGMRRTPNAPRNRIELSPFGVHWPDQDEDLSFRGLLAGD